MCGCVVMCSCVSCHKLILRKQLAPVVNIIRSRCHCVTRGIQRPLIRRKGGKQKKIKKRKKEKKKEKKKNERVEDYPSDHFPQLQTDTQLKIIYIFVFNRSTSIKIFLQCCSSIRCGQHLIDLGNSGNSSCNTVTGEGDGD